MSQFAPYRWGRLLGSWEIVVAGLGRTVLTAGLALLLSLALGALFGVMATGGRVPRFLNRIYVGAIQNLPLVTLVFFCFYGVPRLGIKTTPLQIGVLGLGIYHGAYMAEVIRAGIQSIHKGQLEAALSQGFTYVQAMRYVVLPQALGVVLPPLTNQAVSLIKNTSVLAMIAGAELMNNVDSWAAETGNYGVGYFAIWAIYFILCFPLATWARRWEERTRKAREGQGAKAKEGEVKAA